MKNVLIGAAVVLVAWPWMSVEAATPGHRAIDHLPACRDASAVDACRVDVPNGDFGGPAGDVHSHGDDYFGIRRNPHPVAQHIHPWRYLDPGNRGGGTQDSGPGLELLQMGDSVEQRVPLPAVTSDKPIVYAVHAHTGTWTGNNRVRLDIGLVEGGVVIARADAAVDMGAVRDEPRYELVAKVTVPNGTRPTDLDIAIGSENGYGRVPVADVFVVRAPQDDPVPELKPAW